MVTRDLREVRGGDVFVTGGNVQFEKQHLWVSEIDPQELAQTLLHNVFVAKEESPCLQTRDKKILETQGWSKGWESKVKKLMASLREVDVLEPSRKTVLESLTFQADHMSRPWQGLMSSRESQESGKFRLNSVNGFNSWGSFALSAIKVTEMALLKSLARGVAPKQLRFNLTLPAEKDHLLNHIFESTFRGIESVAEKQGVEIDGGDTFDGKHWHLNVTVGGEALLEPETKFNPHDYLLMTRPLGFGFLWAGRLSEPFDSQWIQRASQESLVPQVEQFLKFLEKWRPSGRVLIEEWGFLFHCLQKLPAHQQLMVNFREVPRWGGTDFLIDKKVDHPGIDVNWQRICSEVAFRREDVSKSNSVMWDSMSQGSLVFGLSAEKWQEALHDLKEIGYKQAALVGCIRPKTKGNRVVLSDWSP